MTIETPVKVSSHPGVNISAALAAETPQDAKYVASSYARMVAQIATEAAVRLSWHEHNPGMQRVDYSTQTSAGPTGEARTLYYWNLVRATHTNSDGAQVETTYFLNRDSGAVGSIQTSASQGDQLRLTVDLHRVDVEVLKMLLFVLTRLG